ncbi:hypothetical protein MYXO_00821 [Myxococcaceae bacterium]|nr:hypothetical protein MYXO_00821 [Myxococcaceae bacterium]
MAWNPTLAAALLAAASITAVAAWLPIRFEAPPNPLGIVSVATVTGYPAQKEMFWLAFGTGAGALVAWLVASFFARRSPEPREQIRIEVAAAASLCSALLLPSPLREAGIVACGVFCFSRVSKAPHAPEGLVPVPHEESQAQRPRVESLLVGFAIVGFALLRPRIWLSLSNLANGVPDLAFASDDWGFLSELGQHLAWADAVRRGEWPGVDYFSLYGPLVSLGIERAWAIAGRSIATMTLYVELVSAWGAVAAMWLAARHLRHRVLALLVPLLALPIRGRYGLGLTGLLFFSYAITSGRAWPMLASGATAGVALFYSQEFGLALVLTAGAGLAVRRNLGSCIAFVAGLAAVVASVSAWLASGGALGAALHDMVSYPTWVMAGFGKLPFPALLPALPLPLDRLFAGGTILLRLAHATIATYVVALLMILRADRLRPRRLGSDLSRLRDELRDDPRRLGIAMVALYGLIAFRSGMGRSEIINLVQASGSAGILLVVALDRTIEALRHRPSRGLATWRLAALGVFVSVGAFLQYSGWVFVQSAIETASAIGSIASGGAAPRGDPAIARLAAWVESQDLDDDDVLFLPSHAAYYYLTDRRSPIRFVVAQHLVTDEQRRETLERLRANPPRYVIWSPRSLVLDGIAHEQYLGPEIMRWLQDEYALLRVQDQSSILERRPSADGSAR